MKNPNKYTILYPSGRIYGRYFLSIEMAKKQLLRYNDRGEGCMIVKLIPVK